MNDNTTFNIKPGTDKDWADYYNKKYTNADKQLKDLAWAFTHLFRFAMNGQKEDAYMIARRTARRLEYPRDKNDLLTEIEKWKVFAPSILREEEKP